MLSLLTNPQSIFSQKYLRESTSQLSKIQERLSSGRRINRASDDAAGLAIATRMESRVRGINTALRNVNDSISYMQTAEGGTETMMKALQRMREIANLSVNGTLDATDRAKYDAEYQQLSQEIDETVSKTKFNGLEVIGADAGVIEFQVGADAGDTLSTTTTDLSTLNDGFGDLTSAANATTELGALDTAIDTLSTNVANIGAFSSRLEFTSSNLENMLVNQEAAKSRILDTDYAKETAERTKQNFLQQANIASLMQANMQPSLALSLLNG